MNNTYSTSQIAKIVNVHPNTVRMYEEIKFLPRIPRKQNGYREYNDIHLEQLKLILKCLRVELLQNGLRKKTIEIIKVSAGGDYDKALKLKEEYFSMLDKELTNVIESLNFVEEILGEENLELGTKTYLRSEVCSKLNITMDTLRNWELNGLLNIKRKDNRYRVYNDYDIKRIKIIKSLRCANFSLSAILRMLVSIEKKENLSIKHVIDIPNPEEDIVSVCDKLITSLEEAKKNSIEIEKTIKTIKKMGK